MTKNKVGRPRLPDEERQRYQRIAVYLDTYRALKEASQKLNKPMIDILDGVVERYVKK